MSASEKLADLAARYWQFECAEAPFAAFLAGQLGEERILFREAPADYDRRYAAAGEFLAELDELDAGEFTGQERATLSLLRRELEGIRAHYEVDAHLRPSLLPVGPDFNTIFYANAVTIMTGADAKRHTDRLALFPAFLKDVRACLEAGYDKGIRYPAAVLAAAAANIRRTASVPAGDSPWYAPFAKSPAATQADVQREAARAIDIIAMQLIPALEAHAAFIAGPMSEGARATMSCTDAPHGEAYYRTLVRHFTTTELSPEEVHDLGHAEIARIEAEMAACAAEAGYENDLTSYRRFLNSDPQFILPDSEKLRERAEIICKRIDARIPAFFGRIPRITYGVDSVPPSLSETMPPAYAQPAPSGGNTAGIFWINGIPEKCPLYLLPAMAVHEAWPGHLMHIGLMAELDALPAFRRHGAVKYTVCVEGWALYCEKLGKELGVYHSPHDHFGRLEMEMWRACRLAVDTGIHWFGWSRDQAIAFMAERLTLTEETIAAEVDRYAALPAQALAYQIGGIKLCELRQRAEDRLGPRFTHRGFHEAVMTAGGVTLSVLDDLVEDWIKAVA